MLKKSFSYLLIGLLGVIACLQLYSSDFYFGYWSQRDMYRGQEMLSWPGIDNWFLGAELSFGGGARIPSGINNIITMLLLVWENSRQMLIEGQFFINLALLLWSFWFLSKNGFEKIGALVLLLTFISPLSMFLMQTYWNPGFLPGLLSLLFSILFIHSKKIEISNKIYVLFGCAFFIALSFHLSVLFLLPSIVWVFKLNPDSKKVKTILYSFFVCLLPYLFYEASTNFVNTKILLEQTNVLNKLIYVGFISISIYGLIKKNAKIFLIGVISFVLAFSFIKLDQPNSASASDFIYLKDKEVMKAVNAVRQDALKNVDNFKINLDLEESGRKITISYLKETNRLNWEIKNNSSDKKYINLDNVKGFWSGIAGVPADTGYFPIIAWAATFLMLWAMYRHRKDKDVLFLYLALWAPFIFYLFINEIGLDRNHSRYLVVASTALIFLIALYAEEEVDYFNKFLFWGIVGCLVIVFKYNIYISSDVLQAKDSKSYPNNSIVYTNKGMGFEISNQVIANHDLDHSDKNLYNLDSKSCFILYDSELVKKVPETVSLMSDKYDIYGRKKRRKGSMFYGQVQVDSMVERKGEYCNLNLKNRYVLSEIDKEMFNFYYKNDLFKESTRSFKLNNNSYYVNIQDEFCVNDCMNIMLKLVFEKDGVYIYSNQLKGKSYNYHFFDTGTLSNVKLNLIDKKTKEKKEIVLFKGVMGYMGVQAPYVKKIEEDWAKYNIEFIAVANEPIAKEKGLDPKRVSISLD